MLIYRTLVVTTILFFASQQLSHFRLLFIIQHAFFFLRSASPWTEVEEQIVSPYETRIFPLTEEEFNQLLAPVLSAALVLHVA